MSRDYPALEVSWDAPRPEDAIERLVAALDDAGATAIEDHERGIRMYFSSLEERDRAIALASAAAPGAQLAALSIPDEGWAERSQAALLPVRVGRIVVAPPWTRETAATNPDDILVVIQPSMGFGTGHHATTRLALRLLQELDLHGRSLLDLGTGSGVLALAGWMLGAAPVLAIDADEDAVTSARESVGLNGAAAGVQIVQRDLGSGDSPQAFDTVTANLTGAMLERHAARIARLVGSGGTLIASGFQGDEEPAVVAAFAANGLATVSRADEEGWLAISASPRPSTTR